MAERVRVREIDDDEGNRLLRIVRRGTGSVVTWRRAQMVLLSAQGMTTSQIAKVAFTSEDRVRDVIHNFNADGFDSLYPKYKGGRKPTFTLPQRVEIKKIAKSRPAEHGLPFSRWSLAKLADFLAAEGVVAHAKLKAVRSGKIVFLVTAVPFRCPAAPYEGAMLAADLLTETGVRADVTIEVYTPEPLPMPVAGPVVGQGVVSMLQAADIGFHPSRQAERIDHDAREVVFGDGERVPFDLLVFVPPHRPPASVAKASLSPAGWIPVDAHTLTTPVDGVWALGDVSAIILTNGKPLPKAAVFAKGEAEAVAAGVARHLGHDAPEPHFNGEGHCYLEAGGHLAAMGAGNFYHPDGPKVEMSEPSRELHEAKAREEAEWLATWNVPA